MPLTYFGHLHLSDVGVLNMFLSMFCSPLAVTLKCAVDQVFMAPFGCALFYTSQALLAGAPGAIAPTMRVRSHKLLIKEKPQGEKYVAWCPPCGCRLECCCFREHPRACLQC